MADPASMSSSSTGSPASGDGRRSVWRLRIGVGALVLLAGGLIFLIAVIMRGFVMGQEFSPDRFDRRFFSYYEIPLIRLQLTPISRSPMTSDLETHLQTNKYVPKPISAKTRWHRVTVGRVGSIWNGEASILCTYLDTQVGEDPLWLAWTKQHPKLAKEFWPEVVRLARRNRYKFLPDLFDLAAQATSSEDPVTGTAQFHSQLNRTLARNYVQLAQTHVELDNHKRAVIDFTYALDHDPKNVAALRGRSYSYVALGESEKARADRQQAAKLQKDKD